MAHRKTQITKLYCELKMSSIKKLQYISLCAKVTQELENHVGVRDKVSAIGIYSFLSFKGFSGVHHSSGQ